MALNLENIDLGSFGIQDEKKNQLNANITEAVKVNPDQHAEVINLSKQSGVPEFAVESNPDEVKQKLKLDQIDLDSMVQRSPRTAKYLTEDLNNTIIAQEDVFENLLQGIERTFENFSESVQLGFKKKGAGLLLKGLDDTPDRIDQLIPNPGGTAGMFMSDLELQLRSIELAESMGINSDEELAEAKEQGINNLVNEIKVISELQQQFTPDDLNIIQEGARSAAVSITENAPGLALGVITRGRTLPLTTIGIQTYLDNYAEGRSQGLDVDAAGWFATAGSIIEVGTEILPLGTLERMLTGKTSGLKKEALKFALQEMGTEQIATLGDTINQLAFGLDDELGAAIEERDFDKAIDIQLRRQAVTAIATLFHGGAQATAAGTVNKVISKLFDTEQVAQNNFEVEQNTIDELNAQAEKSKLKERDVDSFKQFIREVDDENDTQVFVDSVQTSLYLQSKTREQIESDPALKLLDNAVRASRRSGVDAAIPVADFTGDIAGTEHFTELREFMTLSEEQIAPFRQEQHKQETQNYVSNLLDQAQENVSEFVEAQEIYTDVRDQLIDTGAVNAQNASIMAQVVPAWATAQARRSGVSVAEVYQAAGLTIEGPQTGERGRLEGEGVLTQPPPVAREQDFGEIEITDEVQIEGTDEVVTVSQSAQRQFDQTMKRRDIVAKVKDCLNAA